MRVVVTGYLSIFFKVEKALRVSYVLVLEPVRAVFELIKKGFFPLGADFLLGAKREVLVFNLTFFVVDFSHFTQPEGEFFLRIQFVLK